MIFSQWHTIHLNVWEVRVLSSSSPKTDTIDGLYVLNLEKEYWTFPRWRGNLPDW